MQKASLYRSIRRKGGDPGRIAASIISTPERIPWLFESMSAPEPALKYGSEKIVRLISEKRPDLIYPFFNSLAEMIGCENSFLKWGAILSVANLARVDGEGKIESYFDRYFHAISGPAMITAANIIGGSARIALAKPQLADRIAAEILKVEQGEYRTAECRNIAIGHAIDAFDRFFDHIRDQERIVRFVRKQVRNPRAAVRRRAEKFLKKRQAPAEVDLR